MKIVTITRTPADSPNMVERDAAILNSVAQALRASGVTVTTIGDKAPLPFGADAICSMSRTPETLQRLRQAEADGIIIINTPDAVEGCSRIKFMQTLKNHAAPQPPFTIIEDTATLKGLTYPAWIKRGDGWSGHRDDICYVDNADEARAAIEQMKDRGITTYIHCNHINGDIIKFYAVGESYFHYCYPDPEKSKFGLEAINGIPGHFPFDKEKMKQIVNNAAKAIGLEIYGGDCIVNSKGDIYIIDINDFPSFSPIRAEAAKEIAEYITSKLNKNERRR